MHPPTGLVKVMLATADPDRTSFYIECLSRLSIPAPAIERHPPTRDAVESMRDGRFDLVIFEDGSVDAEVLASLASITRESPDVEVVLVAAKGGTGSHHEALQRSGVAVVVRDPERPERFTAELEAIVRAMQHRRYVSQAKSDFVGMVGRDLRNPAGNILGFADLLLGGPQPVRDERHRHSIDRIHKNAEFMLDLIGDMLASVALETGTVRLERRRLDLRLLIADALEETVLLAQAKGISLAGPEPGPPILALVDPAMIVRSLTNLLVNAVKFSHERTHIEAGIERLPDGARLWVRDHGLGIPAAELRRLFRKFSVTSTRPTAGEKGTGLGLFIVSEIARLHHGSVQVESQPDKGSTFSLFLPTGEEELPGPSSSTARAGADAAGPAADRRLFRAMADGPSEVVFVTDAQDRICHTSSNVERSLGFPQSELAGRPLDSLIHPEDGPIVSVPESDRVSRAAGTRSFLQSEWRFRHRDGSWRVFNVRCTQLAGSGGALGKVLVARDLSNWRLVTPAVREAERQSALAFDGAEVGMAVLGADGRLLRVNASWCRMLEREAATLQGLRLTDLCHPDDAAVTGAQVGGLLSGQSGGFRLELRFPTPGRGLLHGGLTAAPMEDREDRLQILLMLDDLTADRRASHALQETSAALSSLLGTGKWEEAVARIAAVAAEQTGSLCGFAGVLEGEDSLKVVGPIPAYLSPVSRPGSTLLCLSAPGPDDTGGLDHLIRQVALGGKPVVAGDLAWSPTSQLHPKDGVQWRRLLALPVLKGRRALGVLAVVAGPGEFSGQERVILENLCTGGAALFESQARLRKQAGLEARSRQTATMRTIRTFTAGISHHFNNLLQIMMGCAQLVDRQLPQGHPCLPNLRTIIQAGSRTSDLIRQLAACGEVTPPRRERAEPNQVILLALPLLKASLGESVAVTTALAPDAGLVEMGTAELERILVVVSQNAADAMPEGGTLSLETRSCQSGELPQGLSGRFVCLSVRDSGCGMESAVLERAFEPFFTTKNMALRAGLGLTTVYALVEAAGGKVEIESAVRAGSTIRIYLPAGAAAPVPGPAVLVEQTRPTPRTPRVLVVEDEPDVRRVVARTLGRRGYTVLEAGTGEDALSLCPDTGDPPDLVVTDISLPGMSGLELVHTLRAGNPGLKVLYITGHALDVLAGIDRSGSREMILHKPFDLNVLQELAASLLAEADTPDRTAD